MTGYTANRLVEIQDWIKREIQPTHFISLQLPIETKTNSTRKFWQSQWLILREAEYNLLGKRWFNKLYRFIGFYEFGQDKTLHSHILMSCANRSTEEVASAFDKAGVYYKDKRHTKAVPDIDVRSIYDTDGVVEYCTKQLGLDRLTHIRSDRIFTAKELFR